MRTRQCAIYLCLGIATTGTRNDGTTNNTRVMLSGEQWRTVDRLQGLTKESPVTHFGDLGNTSGPLDVMQGCAPSITVQAWTGN